MAPAHRRGGHALLAFAATGLLFAGCDGPQSAFVPAGRGAGAILDLWWILAGGAVVIFALVIGLAFYATVVAPERREHSPPLLLIVGGGVAFPLVVLTALLTYSFTLGARLADAPEGALQIEVVGKQWWWEVRYLRPGGDPVISANELHIPVGEPVELLLSATDVIHSFWLPSNAGKRDMIPGRTNSLVIEAEEPGVYRGQCAEYCGGPHAWMAFHAVAQPRETFDAWLDREARPARQPSEPFLAKGQRLFIESGCGTCHRVRGTEADGTFGPDLTHLGGRRSIGAGIMPNNIGTIAGWIADSQHIKPGNSMPSFNVFAGEDLRALAAYLASLE